MKFTLSWLHEWLETDASLEDITNTLTAIGLEVEEVSDKRATFAPFLVAEITEAKPHPDADKLQVCSVFDGDKTHQIVCGAPNARAGLKVVLAPLGTEIPTNGMVIKDVNIRGVASSGMLCSAAELGVGEDSAGIIELPETAKPGEKAAALLGADEVMIEIAITPNRGDCLGVYGIARDLAAAGLGTLKDISLPAIGHEGVCPVSVSIEPSTHAPLFLGCLVNGVTNGESPDWLKQKLTSIGQQPINALVDITNYLTFTYGRPAHVYDADKLSGNISVRLAKAGERFTALDHKEYALDDTMVVIADDSGPLGLGGIIGGESTGCDETTKNVFIEIALFEPINIAHTGRKLQIESDARYRFERMVDPAFAETGMDLAINLVTELCGGTPSEVVKAGEVPSEQVVIHATPEQVSRRLGMEIDQKTFEKCLKAIGCKVEGGSITVPSYRPDLAIPEDISEEVARLVGYDALPATPLPAAKPVLYHTASDHIREVLVAKGLDESVTFSFCSRKEAARFTNETLVEIANPISSELDVLRPTPLPNLLAAASRNQARNFTETGLFEIGPAFTGSIPGEQETVVAAIRTGNAVTPNVHDKTRNVDAFDAKADLFAALSPLMDASRVPLSSDDVPSYYHPGQAGKLNLGKNVIGVFGALHPAILKAFDIETPAIAFELYLDRVPAKKQKGYTKPALTLHKLQYVERDFAFLLDEPVTAESLLRSVRQADKKWIQDVELFDVYQGKGVEDGKKSVAFRVTLQPDEKAFTDEELQAISDKVVTSVSKATGGVLRDGS